MKILLPDAWQDKGLRQGNLLQPIGAWPENRIFATQFGPNTKGIK